MISVSGAVTTATAVVQLVGAGRELVQLWKMGKMSDEDLIRRWNANAEDLTRRELAWNDRQAAKASATAVVTSGRET